MTAPARVAALNALRAVGTGSADLPAALAHSRQLLPDERDRALAADIVTGTLRWQRSLDHLIVHVANRPLGKLDTDVVHVLRLSLYQLLHLTRVPASAVVDDAVDLVRSVRKQSATGFVNAVLRSTLRQRNRLPLPPRPDDPADRESALAYLGVTHSHPEWLVARWLDRHGLDAAEAWVRFNNQVPSLTLRANRLRASRDVVHDALERDGIDTVLTPIAPDGLIVSSGNPLRRPADGLFVVQDEAAQLVPLAVAARPGERVLDLCASPGGKTIAIAADMGDSGTLIACDVRPRRMRLLRATVQHSGARQTRLVQIDGRGDLPFAASFDRVLVDAPCSGLGTVRRDPDIRWRRQVTDLAAFADAQVRLLGRAGAVVRPGGRLVYATCSSEPEENEQVVAAFLAQHPRFRLADLREDNQPVLTPLLDEHGMLRTLPFAHGLEAFFAAVLVKQYRLANPMHLGTRVWSLGKLLLLVGALAATFLLFFGVAMRAALRAREVPVPALLGRSVNEATNALTALGLELRIDENRRPDDKVPNGRIMRQDPLAGVAARRQRTVRVWVSSGPLTNSVPELVGQTERTARIRLEQDGLSVASITEVRSPDYATDTVVAQDPPPSSLAPRVALLLNRGEQSTTYVMPDVIGMEGERAAAALRTRGFRIAIVGSQPYPGAPAGIIVRQQPAGGFQVGPGDTISLEVSR